MHSYKNFIVWQKSMDLVGAVYSQTKLFPSEEIYGLTSQMRRAAVSIPSNIAEGYARRSAKEFRHFLLVAVGSAVELETQLEIAKRLDFISWDKSAKIEALLVEVIKMLHSLIKKQSIFSIKLFH